MTTIRTGTSERPTLSLAVVIGVGGIGMAAARRLGQKHRLLLADLDAERLEQQAAIQRADGYDVRTALCDITNAIAIGGLAEAAYAQGPVQVLAHVTGLSPSMADWRTIMRVNLLGPHLVLEAFLPLMCAGGVAILVASLAGHMAPPAAALLALLDAPARAGFPDTLQTASADPITPTLAYQLSKFALIRIAQRRASAWGRRGARIVSLSPGLIASPMGAMEFTTSPTKHKLLARTPLAREGTMLEIADALEFLASDRASFISGTDLLVDGGIAAALRHDDESV